MHGLINRSIQCFVSDTYGADLWQQVAQQAGVEPEGFEALLSYEDGLTDAVLQAVSARLDKSREVLLEDLGTYLVSNPRQERIRRLLRFGGDSFEQFLHSLEDLPGRARMALNDLQLPDLELLEEGAGEFRLLCRWHMPGAGHVMTGMLRAMADDYGALVLLEVGKTQDGAEVVQVELLDGAFAEGKQFELGAAAGQGA